MRKLTENEKKLIKELIDLYSPCSDIRIGDVLINLYPIQSFKRVTLPGDRSLADNRFVEVAYYYFQGKDLICDLYESLVLIDELCKNRYLIIHQLYSEKILDGEIIGEEINVMVPIDVNRNGMLCKINLGNFLPIDLLLILSSNYTISNALKDYSRDFKTIEERRFEHQLDEAKKQTTSSRKAFYVSLGAFALAAITLILTLIIPTKIHKTQIESIQNSIERVNSLNHAEVSITDDTLQIE